MSVYRIHWFGTTSGDFLVSADSEEQAEEKFLQGDFDDLCRIDNLDILPQLDHIIEEQEDE